MGAYILVGCGGTGIETLIRVNELLSEDTYWRPRLDSDFFYVLVDTEKAKLDEFQESLHLQLGDVGKQPFVEILSLGQGYDNLQQPVNEIFIKPFGRDGKKGNGKARERLMAHWWHLPDGEPFKAERVKPLWQGAGQCPSISYLLTWKMLKRIEQVFSRVINSVQARKNEENPLDAATFIITGSLAGGTGRGSWKLLSFKLRELFGKLNRMPRPLAYLSDVTVFQNVIETNPKQELAMRVNSITGISEISAWLKNVMPQAGTRPPRIEYRLPSMTKADDEEADVLKLPAEDVTAYAPADAVFLTFRQSGRSFLNDNHDAHSMVGTSIYAGLSRKAIRGREINDANKQYWSAAAATFEVPAMTLGRYFESHACIQTLSEMLQPDRELARAKADEFIRLHPWVMPTGISHIEPRKDGDLLDRVWFHLTEEIAQDWGDLETAMRDEQDVDLALDTANVKSGAMPRAVNAAIKAVADLDPVALVADFARKLYLEVHQTTDEATRAYKDQRVASLATAGEFVSEVTARIDAKLKQLQKETYNVAAGQGVLDAIKNNSGRDMWVLGKRFNDAEIVNIKLAFEQSVFAANFKLIKAKIEEKVKSWLVELNRLAAGIRAFCTVADRVSNGYQDALNKEFNTNGYDPFDQLFTNPDEPEHSLPDRFDPDRFYRRNVKPVLTREAMRAMLAEGLRHVDHRAIDKLVIENCFDKPLPAGQSNRANDLTVTLRTAVDESVALDRAFVRKNFSLENLIEKLRDCWQMRLQRAMSKQHQFTELSKRFSAFFGVEPEVAQGSVRLASRGVDFIAKMGASLAGRCKPYWQIDSDAESDFSVSLFMPAWSGRELEQRKQEIHDAIAAELGETRTRIDVVVEQGETANPFVMLAYSAATADEIEHIRSLDYWQDHPEVKRMLELCESKSGSSLFDPRTNGVGFTDPMYVMHNGLAAIRWRPWYTGAEEERERQALAIDALIYGMLEPTDDLQTALGKLGWSMPMMKVDKLKITFSRVDYLWENGKRRDNPQCPWKTGDAAEKSLVKLHELLDGVTEDGPHPDSRKGRPWRDAILAEAERFWGEVSTKVGFGPGTDKRRELLEYQQKLLAERRKTARLGNKTILERMIARLADKLV